MSAVPPELSAQTLFQAQWQIYRKLVDRNYLFHREAYGRLHQVLRDELEAPFRLLDLACGDASAVVSALQGTAIATYHGIDLSQAALTLAAANLAALHCPITLEQRDFAAAVRDWQEPVEVVWIGLSLHHLPTPEKLAVMGAVRRIVGESGRFLIYEDTSRAGETRAAWLARWDAQRPDWTAFSDAEWEAVTGHVHAEDFPESDAKWRELGHAAGFNRVEELYAAPTDLLRLYCFRG